MLHINADIKLMLPETDPTTYWQTRHYEGWPSLLVRYDSSDPERIFEMIEAARNWAISRKPPGSSRRRSGRWYRKGVPSQKWEIGAVQPATERLSALAQALKVSMDWLLDRETRRGGTDP